MTSLPFFQVDAFAERPLTGNPAAVMPLEQWLDEEVMQAIAAENNLAETAFTVPAENDQADYDLRWFTPTVEVSRRGDLLDLDMPSAVPEKAELPELLDALGITGQTFLSRSGNGNALVLLDNEQAVLSVRPDFSALAKLPYLVSVTAPGDEHDVASRVFAAFHGVPEDPVTGSAHTALVPFWAERLGRNEFTALQASRRTGVLYCRLEGDRVLLGGRCQTVIVGQFQL
jgi:predicted PhzF superfamily epimerase YddE/YHI9